MRKLMAILIVLICLKDGTKLTGTEWDWVYVKSPEVVCLYVYSGAQIPTEPATRFIIPRESILYIKDKGEGPHTDIEGK